MYFFSSGALHRDSYSSVSGIPTAVYVGGADSWSNASSCFCPTDGPCPASGARDMTKCVGIPLYLSWPHFYLADSSYRDAVVGMNPDPALHQLRFEMSDVSALILMQKRLRNPCLFAEIVFNLCKKAIH